MAYLLNILHTVQGCNWIGMYIGIWPSLGFFFLSWPFSYLFLDFLYFRLNTFAFPFTICILFYHHYLSQKNAMGMLRGHRGQIISRPKRKQRRMWKQGKGELCSMSMRNYAYIWLSAKVPWWCRHFWVSPRFLKGWRSFWGSCQITSWHSVTGTINQNDWNSRFNCRKCDLRSGGYHLNDLF